MKIITIEQLLRWAFVHELSKGGGVDGIDNPLSAWRTMEGVATLGVRVDVDRCRQDLPTFIEQGEPHKDALIVGQAVRDLAKWSFKVDEFDDILADWPELERILAKPYYEAVLAHLKMRSHDEKGRSLVALVISYAVLNRRPSFDMPVPKIHLIENAGKPCWFIKKTHIDAFGRQIDVEVDGFNYRSRRPLPNAYRKHILADNPKADIFGRIDYQLWCMAMLHLRESLMGQLKEHQLQNEEFDLTPWMQKKFDNENKKIVAI